MSHRLIKAALDTKLNTVYTSNKIAWELTQFAPVKGQDFAKPYYLPAESRQAALGSTAADREVGVYQVSVYSPSKNGIVAAQTLADLVKTGFRRGTTLTASTVAVVVEQVHIKPAVIETDWTVIPVDINWRSDVNV